MGLRASPEWAARYYYIAKEMIRGNKTDVDNPFFFDKVVINTLGNEDFNPSLPWVFKFDSIRKRTAGDAPAYVDNLRAMGWSREHAWRIA